MFHFQLVRLVQTAQAWGQRGARTPQESLGWLQSILFSVNIFPFFYIYVFPCLTFLFSGGYFFFWPLPAWTGGKPDWRLHPGDHWQAGFQKVIKCSISFHCNLWWALVCVRLVTFKKPFIKVCSCQCKQIVQILHRYIYDFMISPFFVSLYFWTNCKAYISSTFAKPDTRTRTDKNFEMAEVLELFWSFSSNF